MRGASRAYGMEIGKGDCSVGILAPGCQIFEKKFGDARRPDCKVKDPDFQTFATVYFVL